MIWGTLCNAQNEIYDIVTAPFVLSISHFGQTSLNLGAICHDFGSSFGLLVFNVIPGKPSLVK